MSYFTTNFDGEMERVQAILEQKGAVLESDHPYAYEMQYDNAFEEVKKWLENHGYSGTVDKLGWYDGVAVYGLYDTSIISFDKMMELLKEEARTQN